MKLSAYIGSNDTEIQSIKYAMTMKFVEVYFSLEVPILYDCTVSKKNIIN